MVLFDPLAYNNLEKELLVITGSEKREERMNSFLHQFEHKNDPRACIVAVHLQTTELNAGDVDFKNIMMQALRYVLTMGNDERHMPIVIDSGASISITGRGSDFIGPIHPIPSTTIQGLNHTLDVKGKGMVRWEVVDQNGELCVIETMAYYIPEAQVRLFSPKTYFDEQSNDVANFNMNKKGVKLTLGNKQILSFPYQNNNLPLMLTPDMVEPKKMFHLELENVLHSHTCVGDGNRNLSAPKKELLKWHWKWAHISCRWIQSLMGPKRPRSKVTTVDKCIIRTYFSSTRTCEIPVCEACRKARATIRGSGVAILRKRPGKQGGVVNQLTPGECVSTDQYVSGTHGRLTNTFGKEKDRLKYTGGTIYYDHSSSLIHTVNQVGLMAAETLKGKNDCTANDGLYRYNNLYNIWMHLYNNPCTTRMYVLYSF